MFPFVSLSLSSADLIYWDTVCLSTSNRLAKAGRYISVKPKAISDND